MKSLKLILVGVVLFLAGAMHAQVSVSVNIGSPPLWGPVGYSDVRFYYLPDVEAYYDVHSSMFIYYVRGNWVHRSHLPSRYRNYDLYDGYKVVITDYRGNEPYQHFRDHKSRYSRGYRGPVQHSIGERPMRGHHGQKMRSNDRHRRDNDQGHNRNSRNNHNDRKGKKGHGGSKGKRK